MKINTTLQVSRLQKWSEVLLWFMVCLILIFSEMPLWGKGLALMLMCFLWAYQCLLQPPTVRLVQLIQFDKQIWRWSVLEPSRIKTHHFKKTNIAEGRLVGVQGGFCVLVLRFETIAKNRSVIKNWVIWRDQVDADHWRRLVVIARFWADDVPRIMD